MLVVLVFGSGMIWLFDYLFLATGRREVAPISAIPRVVQREAVPSTASSRQRWRAGGEGAGAGLEYSKSFFPGAVDGAGAALLPGGTVPDPESSMVPTLQVGDYILVNKFTYGIRLPVMRTKVMDLNEPQRGDVMVFFRPGRTTPTTSSG